MRIAILVTNTDETEFAQKHPNDGEKFSALLAAQRPDWSFDVFLVKDGEFPDDLSGFDGVVITGSPASVHDDTPWVARLMDLIKEIAAQRLPMFGACFGHQAIAQALGGQVEANPGGWVLGLTETKITQAAPWMDTEAGKIDLYAAHCEQVTGLPKDARVLSTSAECPIGSFAIGNHIFTTEYHPEMTPEFVAALVEEISDRMDPDVITQARASLVGRAETERFARWIVSFFETARG